MCSFSFVCSVANSLDVMTIISSPNNYYVNIPISLWLKLDYVAQNVIITPTFSELLE